jgi:hypothetical protein
MPGRAKVTPVDQTNRGSLTNNQEGQIMTDNTKQIVLKLQAAKRAQQKEGK